MSSSSRRSWPPGLRGTGIPAGRPGDDSAGYGRAQGAGLGRAGDLHLLPRDVGVDLHDERILFGDAAAVADLIDGDAVLLMPPDDGQGAEGGRFDERPVDLLGPRPERLADEKSGKPLIDEDRPIAVVPVESEEPDWPGRRRRFLRVSASCEPFLGPPG
jgi:hypothetical protein